MTESVLLLSITPSWGQPVCVAPGCNPTTSDAINNTAGGTGALSSLVVGSNSNTAFGRNALNSNTSGVHNTASGRNALRNNTTGDDNTASGHLALEGNITGFGNTAAGREALSNSTGNKNIGIGYRAGTSLGTGNNNIYIGNQGAGDESQTIRIGTAQTETFIAGIAGVPISLNVNGATMAVDTTTGQLGIAVQISSARYKRDIATMGTRSEGVLNLRPVTFVYRDDSKGTTHYGLIAEEVATVYPELVTYTPTGEVQGVRYQELIPMLLNELQRQRQEFQQTLQTQARALQSQQQAVQLQQQELAELRALVGQGRGKVVLGGMVE